MKATRHNGRVGKNGAYNPKHNDRRFNVENSEHIDAERAKKNVYWDCMQGYDLSEISERDRRSFEDIEKMFYTEKYFDYVMNQNERNEQGRHPERNRKIGDLLTDKRTCPEETLLQLGNIDGSVSAQTLAKISMEYFEEFERRYGSHIHILDWALHLDEATPHIHERHVFDAVNRYGEVCPQQDKALEELGFELPEPTKKKGKYNNRKMSFDAECRKLFISIAKRHGIDVDMEAVYGGKSYLEKQDYIIENQQKRIERKQEILDELVMKIDDVNAVVDEAVDLAYDKACEVVTEKVRQETTKQNIDTVKEYKAHISKRDDLTKNTKDTALKVIDGVLQKLEKASAKILTNIRAFLQEPRVKEKVKEEVRERARVSIHERLRAAQEEVKARERQQETEPKREQGERSV